jgi:hypothetical protein
MGITMNPVGEDLRVLYGLIMALGNKLDGIKILSVND